MVGSGRGYGGGGAEPDSAVSLSSTEHKKTVDARNACVCESVNVHVHVRLCGPSLWSVFFLYRWFCPLICVPGSVSILCRDGVMMLCGLGK